MGELVEYDGDEVKEKATTEVYAIRKVAGNDTHTHEERERVVDECIAREEAGRYYVRILVTPKDPHRRPTRSSTEQFGASAGRGVGRADIRQCRVNMTSYTYGVGVTTNASRVAGRVKDMTRGAKLQEAIEEGVAEQWHHDDNTTVDLLTVTTPERPMFWGDIMGEPLDPDEVARAQQQDIEYFKQMGVYCKVLLSDAMAGNRKSPGVRWVDVKPTALTGSDWLRKKSRPTTPPSCSQLCRRSSR